MSFHWILLVIWFTYLKKNFFFFTDDIYCNRISFRQIQMCSREIKRQIFHRFGQQRSVLRWRNYENDNWFVRRDGKLYFRLRRKLLRLASNRGTIRTITGLYPTARWTGRHYERSIRVHGQDRQEYYCRICRGSFGVNVWRWFDSSAIDTRVG